MARSLLRQLEQIRRSATYDDAVANANTSAVAEPTVSGSLQDDMNVIRTLIGDVVGNTNWYDALETYEDPSAIGSDKTADLKTMSGNTLDAHTVIIAVSDYGTNNDGFAVVSTTSGILRTITTLYADTTDTRGLPIYSSVGGTYQDEGGADNVCRIDVINQDDAEFEDSWGNIIYAKMHDGLDYPTGGGSGETTDVYFKFYADGVECTLSGVTPTPTAVKFVYPQRKIMSEMEEYDWLRTDFISSWEGDVELVEDISNLWSFTGATDNDGDAGPWNNGAANYLLESDPDDLKAAIDYLNDEVGDRDYSGKSYITTGETIVNSLKALADQVKVNEDATTAAAPDKYVESLSGAVTANVEHPLPAAVGTYTTFSGAGQEGKNMDIYVDGQLLAADTGSFGVNADRDYGETSVSGVTFRFNLQIGRNVTYVVRQ